MNYNIHKIFALLFSNPYFKNKTMERERQLFELRHLYESILNTIEKENKQDEEDNTTDLFDF